MRHTFAKYRENLSMFGDFIYSYNTKVAKVDRKNKVVVPLGYWSPTTTKHINYAAKELGYKKL